MEMVKTTKRHFRLEAGEYIITPNHPDAPEYEVYLRGKRLNDVTTIVRINLKIYKHDDLAQRTLKV